MYLAVTVAVFSHSAVTPKASTKCCTQLCGRRRVANPTTGGWEASAGGCCSTRFTNRFVDYWSLAFTLFCQGVFIACTVTYAKVEQEDMTNQRQSMFGLYLCNAYLALVEICAMIWYAYDTTCKSHPLSHQQRGGGSSNKTKSQSKRSATGTRSGRAGSTGSWGRGSAADDGEAGTRSQFGAPLQQPFLESDEDEPENPDAEAGAGSDAEDDAAAIRAAEEEKKSKDRDRLAPPAMSSDGQYVWDALDDDSTRTSTGTNGAGGSGGKSGGGGKCCPRDGCCRKYIGYDGGWSVLYTLVLQWSIRLGVVMTAVATVPLFWWVYAVDGRDACSAPPP